MDNQHSFFEMFDAEEGEHLKQLGMSAAAGNNKAALNLARRVARALGRKMGEVTADDVGRILKRDYSIDTLGPAAGSLFRDPSKCWRFTGEWKKSVRTTNHRRMIRIWEYVR